VEYASALIARYEADVKGSTSYAETATVKQWIYFQLPSVSRIFFTWQADRIVL